MKKTITVSLALLAMASLSFGETLQQSVNKFQAQASKLLKNKDIDGFSKFMKANSTSDFQYVEAGKSMKLDEMLQGMSMSMGSMKKVLDAKTRVLSCVNVTKTTAKSKSSHSMSGVIAMGDKKDHRMGFFLECEELYRLEGGTWKLSKMTVNKSSATKDGKPFDMSKGN